MKAQQNNQYRRPNVRCHYEGKLADYAAIASINKRMKCHDIGVHDQVNSVTVHNRTAGLPIHVLDSIYLGTFCVLLGTTHFVNDGTF